MSRIISCKDNNNITIKSTDEFDGPGSGGLRGSSRVWYKVAGDRWKQSQFRSEHECVQAIRNAESIASAIKAIKDYE